MTRLQCFCTLGLTAMLACAPSASAQDIWKNDRYHLSMQLPADWELMTPTLLAQTNAEVGHVTGRGFIAGMIPNGTQALVFPYILTQFKPYSSLAQRYRLTSKPSEYDKLNLLYGLTVAFRQNGPLPPEIDTPQFIDQFGSKYGRLVRLEDDGRLDFAGKIPHESGGDPIRYHTHGVIGKEGVALVTVFSMESASSINKIIAKEMRTLALAEGHGMAALPDVPPTPDPNATTAGTTTTGQPGTANNANAEQPTEPLPPVENPANSNALIAIIGLMGVALLAMVLIAWFVTHRRAQARRERKRARRERQYYASQGSAHVEGQPQMTQQQPTTARSRGNTDHHKHGTNRS